MHHQFVVVRDAKDGWTLGRRGDPFLRFDSREAAIARGSQLLERIEGASLVADEEPAPVGHDE